MAVVSEVNESISIDTMYRQGIYAVNYDDLVAGCVELIEHDPVRQRIQVVALNSISKYPQKLFTQEVLDS